MDYADVHCHLEHERFKEDLDEVVNRARKNKVKLIISSGVNPSTNRRALALAKKYPDIVKASFGIYPVDAVANKVDIAEEFIRHVEKFDIDKELKWIEENSHKCIAIGEVGLDYKIVKGHNDLQKENFRKCISLANKLNKTLIIHSRNAEGDTMDLLEEMKAKKVVMHCFQGKKSLIKKGLDLGFYFSIPAVITRLEHFKMMVELIPIENLLTETDAPYLAREVGGRSESTDVINTIKIISQIKGLSEGEVAKRIWKNTRDVFNF